MAMIEILSRNSDYLAVNKGFGVSVHNGEDPQNLLFLLEEQLGIPKLYPVHRLDKETSGVQVLALTSEAASRLAQEFEKRSVRKIYLGILRGQLKINEGVWSQPLTDKAEGRRSPAGQSKDRVPCETRFHLIKESQYFSMYEFELVTGRQHQIRKHAAVSNHHLVGDSRYGDPKYNQKMAKLYGTDRMFLHCSRIEILGQVIQSPLPLEFNQIINGETKNA